MTTCVRFTVASEISFPQKRCYATVTISEWLPVTSRKTTHTHRLHYCFCCKNGCPNAAQRCIISVLRILFLKSHQHQLPRKTVLWKPTRSTWQDRHGVTQVTHIICLPNASKVRCDDDRICLPQDKN